MVLAYSQSYAVDADFLSLMLSKLNNYLASQAAVSSAMLDACISLGQVLGELPVTAQYYSSLLDFLSSALKKSKVVSAQQASLLIALAVQAPLNSTAQTTAPQAFSTSVSDAYLSSTLPQQAPLLTNTTHSGRVTGDKLNQWSTMIGNVSLSFPDNWTTAAELPTSAVLDLQMMTFPASNVSQPEVVVSLKRSGDYGNFNLKLRTPEPVSLPQSCAAQYNVSLPRGNASTPLECVLSDGNAWNTSCIHTLQVSNSSVVCGVGSLGAISFRSVIPDPSIDSVKPLPAEDEDCDNSYAPLGLCLGLCVIGGVMMALGSLLSKSCLEPVVPTERKEDLAVTRQVETTGPLTDHSEIPLPPYCSVEDDIRHSPGSPEQLKTETDVAEPSSFKERWLQAHGLFCMLARPAGGWRLILPTATSWIFTVFWLGLCYHTIDESDAEGSWRSYSGQDFGFAVFAAALGCFLASGAFLLTRSSRYLFQCVGVASCALLQVISVAFTVYFNKETCAGSHWAEGVLWAVLLDAVLFQAIRASLLALRST